MSLDFTSISGGQEVQTSNSGGLLNLNKGDFLNLTKMKPGLRNIELGAGWNPSKNGVDFDLDISVLLLNQNGKLTGASDVVFFNNLVQPGVRLMGDNRTGVGDGDDETIKINLSEVSSNVKRIVLAITIDKARERQQTFGMVKDSYVRLIDNDEQKELCRFNLNTDGAIYTGLIFAELYNDNGNWYFKAIGDGRNGDLNQIAQEFL